MPASAGVAALLLAAVSPQTVEAFLSKWREDAFEFLRHDAPRIAGILLIAVVLLQLLRLGTRKLERHSHAQARLSHMRAQQMRTLAGILRSVGIALVVFLAAMEVLQTLGVN